MTRSEFSSTCLLARFHSRLPSEARPTWGVLGFGGIWYGWVLLSLGHPESLHLRRRTKIVFSKCDPGSSASQSPGYLWIVVAGHHPRNLLNQRVGWKMEICKFWSQWSLRNIQLCKIRVLKGKGDLLGTFVTSLHVHEYKTLANEIAQN